jgi:phosphoketolase
MSNYNGGVSGSPGWTGDVAMLTALNPELRDRMNAYWRAANYLSVGQDMPEIVNPQWRQPR